MTSVYTTTAVNKEQSSDGVHWSSPTTLATFLSPANQSPDGTIFYAPYPQAQGYSNGLWSVVFQINYSGYNNAYICTSNRGCGLVNAGADDEFLVGTSVSGDSGYWVNYYAYSTLNTRSLPLITQAVYFPAGSGPVGATTFSGVYPSSSWYFYEAGGRCPAGCYAAGDYNNIASNPAMSSLTPIVTESTSLLPALWNEFLTDPQGPPTAESFKPNFIPYPMSADLRSLGQPLAPSQLGVSAQVFNRHGNLKNR